LFAEGIKDEKEKAGVRHPMWL